MIWGLITITKENKTEKFEIQEKPEEILDLENPLVLDDDEDDFLEITGFPETEKDESYDISNIFEDPSAEDNLSAEEDDFWDICDDDNIPEVECIDENIENRSVPPLLDNFFSEAPDNDLLIVSDRKEKITDESQKPTEVHCTENIPKKIEDSQIDAFEDEIELTEIEENDEDIEIEVIEEIALKKEENLKEEVSEEYLEKLEEKIKRNKRLAQTALERNEKISSYTRKKFEALQKEKPGFIKKVMNYFCLAIPLAAAFTFAYVLGIDNSKKDETKIVVDSTEKSLEEKVETKKAEETKDYEVIKQDIKKYLQASKYKTDKLESLLNKFTKSLDFEDFDYATKDRIAARLVYAYSWLAYHQGQAKASDLDMKLFKLVFDAYKENRDRDDLQGETEAFYDAKQTILKFKK